MIKKFKIISNPSRNQYENFNPITTCDDPHIRYEPKGPTFPKYDWFTVMLDEKGNKIVKGEQSKLENGEDQRADDTVVSVKLSTLTTGLSEWERQGWLVLGGPELEQYLGSTLSFASVCIRHSESKRKREVMDIGSDTE